MTSPKNPLSLYSRLTPTLPRTTRLFLRARWKLTPYAKMSRELPGEGRLLDLGCGHGLLALQLALESPAREVLGIDHDGKRVALARAAGAGLPNLRFEPGSALEPAAGPFRGIALIDMLHYFAPAEQARIVAQAHAALENGGTLIAREVDPEGGLVSRWNRLYEKLATLTGFTQARRETQHFRSVAGWKALFREAGFLVSAEPCSHPLFADILYVCKKPH
ncbi:MAG: class I SAM-dependent methyltransferase [Oligoflexia bacterium]|nr:class I SAM-dependent methyltransferase [Oligoflexia bacterium]